MKRFFLVVSGLLFTALIATVAVWFLLQQSLPASVPVESATTTSGVLHTEKVSSTVQSVADTRTVVPTTNYQPTTAQKEAAAAVGIDLEAVVLTPAMIECAKEQLSTERIDAMVAGAAPTFLEALALVPCVTAR